MMILHGMKKNGKILLPLWLFFLLFLCSCESVSWKTPIDYGASRWFSGSNDLIQVEMIVNSDKTAYSLITYNENTKRYKNNFVSEKLYFINVDGDGNLILQDGHVTGFSADIIDLSNGSITCSLNYRTFLLDFSGSSNDVLDTEYIFTLYIAT